MPRAIPDELKAVLATNNIIQHTTLQLTTRESIVYRWSTTEAEIGGNLYTARLKEMGVFRQTLGRAPDNQDFTLVNLDAQFGRDFIVVKNLFDQAEVIASDWFVDPDTGDDWLIPYFRGVAANIQGTLEELRGTIMAESVMKGILASRRPFRHCQYEFKDPATCGYVGAETTCSKLLDDTNGCTGRSNSHRFGGFPKAVDADTLSTYAYTTNSPQTTTQGWAEDAYRTAVDYRL